MSNISLKLILINIRTLIVAAIHSLNVETNLFFTIGGISKSPHLNIYLRYPLRVGGRKNRELGFKTYKF
jgi:hypothetical protein